MLTPDALWWNQTFGPSTVITRIGYNLCSNRVLVVSVDPNLSYRHEMREAVLKYFQDNFDNKYSRIDFDCVDDVNIGEDICKAILIKASGFEDHFHRSNQTYIDILINGNFLNDKLLWIKGINTIDTFHMLVKFVAEYTKKTKNDCGKYGKIVIEATSDVRGRVILPFPIIDSYKIISETDIESFALALFQKHCEEGNEPSSYLLSRYVSTLMSCLCGNDAELVEILIPQTDFVNDDIFTKIQDIKDQGDLPAKRGNTPGNGRYPHPFYLLKSKKFHELSKLIWKAQLQTFFPLIEEKKNEIIDTHYSTLNLILPQIGIKEKNNSNDIINPYDLEVSHILYCQKLYSVGLNKVEYECLNLLREARNILAHIEILTPKLIIDLLKLDTN